MNWVQELKDYHKFLQWDEYEQPDYQNMLQEKAKQQLIKDLEFIIGTNGWSELYDSERELINKLGIKEQ